MGDLETIHAYVVFKTIKRYAFDFLVVQRMQCI